MRIPLVFKGDMSASTRTYWAELPAGMKRVAIGIGWPATGTPVGTLSIELATHKNESVTGAVYTPAPSLHPTGGAANLLIDNIVTAARSIAVVYTRTSGGTGASFTDETGVAGTKPTLIVRE